MQGFLRNNAEFLVRLKKHLSQKNGGLLLSDLTRGFYTVSVCCDASPTRRVVVVPLPLGIFLATLQGNIFRFLFLLRLKDENMELPIETNDIKLPGCFFFADFFIFKKQSVENDSRV